VSRDIVEQCTDRPDDRAAELISVSVRPQLLLRGAHADEHDAGPMLDDVLDHALVVG
jgi:hypothetical protein